MDSDSVTMETDDDDSSFEEEEEEEEEECQPKQEVWVQSGTDSRSYKPVHLNISYQMDVGDQSAQAGNSHQTKRTKGNDPAALAVLRRLTPELQQGYRILIDLMGERCKSFAWPFMDKVDPVLLKLPDYYDRIKNPMWLTRIEEKFEDKEYTSITEFVADVRQIFENCYRYNGLKHAISRQAQMMESHFEQKLTQLSKHIRDKTHFRVTHNPPTPEEDAAMSSAFGRRVSQRIIDNRVTLTPVADAMEKQLEKEEEERRKQRIIERKAELERLNKRLLEWEKEELLVEPLATQLKSMWEIPAIGQFLKLCCENMYLPEFSIFELERALVLPQSSKLLARIFTNVLTTRYHRKRVSKKPPMPYEFWQDKLRNKLDIWYAFLSVESATRQSVARHLYISERFFEVLGDVNPLTGRQFHDLSIYERVWILKGMCDHLFETDYDVWFGVDTSTVEDQRAVVLGEDDERASYLYFPHFLSTDLRIYRQAQIKEEKPQKKSPVKKVKKEAEETGTPSEGPKKRGRPRKNPETDDSASEKTGKTPGTPSREGPKKRGRPRKDAETKSEPEAKSEGMETGGAVTTPSQPTAGAKPGRGRPRKDGSTPVQAPKKTPAKPTAIVTPTRRSSRRAARLERAEQEEQNEDKEEKRQNNERDKEESDGDKERVADKVGDSQSQGGNLESQDQTCEGTDSAAAIQAGAVCDGSPGRTENQAGMESRETEACVGNSNIEHLETISEKTEAAVDGLSGKDEGRTSGMNEGGGSPSEVTGKSPSEHALCNGVMEVDETDAKNQTHSSDSKDGEKILSVSHVDQINAEEEISNGNDVRTFSCDQPAHDVEPMSHNDTQHVDTPSNGFSSLNQNQSNNVLDIDVKVEQLPGEEVASMEPCNNMDTGAEVVSMDLTNDHTSADNQTSCAKRDSSDQLTSSMEVDKDAGDVGALDGQPPAALDKNAEAASQSDKTAEAVEAVPEIKEESHLGEEEMDVMQSVKTEGDVKQEEDEVVGRIPTPPPPQPLPGILPPEGEFKLVCDSVESFRLLIEKFAQKEETIVKGRKTIIQPIKRSGRTTELHKTLTKMLEDFEPIEAKLQKVVHKAREVVYNEYEAYKTDPSPNQEAASYWYELHVKKPVQAVESSSVEVSSVDDDFSSSESSSELDSDELSDNDSDGDDTAEYDDTDDDYAPVGRDATLAAQLNGSEGNADSEGGKIDLYSGVEIAGRSMRSSKRRRAQKREDIRDRKKAKRSKIQIVKGAPLQGRYVKQEEEEETDETKLKKVHEELKENLKAGSTFQMTKKMVAGAAQNFEPYKRAALPTSSRRTAPKKEPSPAFQRDTSERFIRILKRNAGSSESSTVAPLAKPTKTSAHEPTLKVPFLQKSKSTSQAAADAATGEKKMKTETFSFTIDAKVWESLKDKPEERQRLIVEHVEKMRVAGGQKKDPQQKTQNSRQSPWFSRNSSPNSSGKSTSSQPHFESPEKKLRVGMENTSHGQLGQSSSVLQQKQATGIQEDMPILDPVDSQMGSLLHNTNMPTLAPVVTQKIVQSNIIGRTGSISVQQALTQPPGLQKEASGTQSTAISSSGNSVSTSLPREQLFILLPNGQLTRSDGSLVETKRVGVSNKAVVSLPQQRVVVPQVSSVLPFGTQPYMYFPYQNVGNHLTVAAPGSTQGNVVSRNVQTPETALSLNAGAVHPTAATVSTPSALQQVRQASQHEGQLDPQVVKSPPPTPCTLYILPPSNRKPAACNPSNHASKPSASQGKAPSILINAPTMSLCTNAKQGQGWIKGQSGVHGVLPSGGLLHGSNPLYLVTFQSPVSGKTTKSLNAQEHVKNDGNRGMPGGVVFKQGNDKGIVKLPVNTLQQPYLVLDKVYPQGKGQSNIQKHTGVAEKPVLVAKNPPLDETKANKKPVDLPQVEAPPCPSSSADTVADDPSAEGVFRLLNKYFDDVLQHTLGPLYEPVSGEDAPEAGITETPVRCKTSGKQSAGGGMTSKARKGSMAQNIISGGVTPSRAGTIGGVGAIGGVGTALPSHPGSGGSTVAIKPQATLVLSPNRQGVQQVASPPPQDINRLASMKIQSAAAQPTAGATGAGVQKTIVLPTNLKVNMNNKQYKILYVQKPGASKPELCLQPCAADGSTPAGGTLQGALPLVTMQQPLQPVPAATTGRNMQIQMVPQGANKIVMQAVGGPPQGQVAQNVMLQSPTQPQVVQKVVPQNPLQGQAVQNVVLQNPVVPPQVLNPAAGTNTNVVTMISTPIPPVPPSVYGLSTGTQASSVVMQSQVPAGSVPSVVSTPSVQMASMVQVPAAVSPVSVVPPANQSTLLAGSTSKVLANQQVVHLVDPSAVAPTVAQPMVSPVGHHVAPSVASYSAPHNNVILQAASASGLLLSAPEPTMKQIGMKGMHQGSGH